MDFRFYLINESTGVQTEIEEPVNFDSFKPILRRDKKFHGVNFEFSEQPLGFYGKAYKLVTDTYNVFGIDGVLIFLVEYNCNGEWQEFYKGTLDYAQYEEVTGDGCMVNVGIAQLGVPMTLKNRMETKVDLDTLSGFEGAELPAYSNLGKTMSIPSKTVLLENSARGNVETSIDFGDGKIYKIPFGGNVHIEIPDFDSEQSFRELGNNTESPIFINNIKGIEAITYSIDSRLEILFSNRVPVERQVDIYVDYNIYDASGNIVNNISSKYQRIGFVSMGQGYYAATLSAIQFYKENIEIKKGHRLCITLRVASSFGNGDYGANATLIDSHIVLKTNSKITPTNVRTFAIHEALSRIAEVSTNNSLTVKSNYYGRKDSQINPTQTDGIGSLRCITNGYFLRRATSTNGSAPSIYISLKDILDGLNAIDAIGYNIKDDKLRIEPWEYFYTDDVILRCHDISEVKRKTDVEKCFQLVDIGYDKWEAEEWNGIDGFHGKRQYRTKLKNSDTKSEQFCKFIADSYAIEATRRKGLEDNTKDWRYDNNIFIIDLIRDADSSLKVNTGDGNLSTLIDPNTVFNVDLIPARMAARWFGWVMQAMRVKRLAIGGTYSIIPGQCIQCGNCYGDYPNAFINGGTSALFVGGVTEITPSDTNLEQDIQGGIEVCPSGAITIEDEGMAIEGNDELIFTGAEGYADAITTSKHAESVVNGEVLEKQNWNAGKIINRNPVPKFKPELVEFEYPLTATEFIAIRNNPHGLIEFNGEYGWIREIEADLLEGMAKFTLIPKRS
jgi:ferredoxin